MSGGQAYQLFEMRNYIMMAYKRQDKRIIPVLIK